MRKLVLATVLSLVLGIPWPATAATFTAVDGDSMSYQVDYLDGSRAPRVHAGSSAGSYPPPITGSQPWATLLCQFGGDASQPQGLSFFQGLMGSAFPGMDHYWRELSFNRMNLTGSQVFDWTSMPGSFNQYFPSGGDFDAGLEAVLNDCIEVHNPLVDFQDYSGINMFLNRDPGNPPCDCALGGIFSAGIDGPSKTYGFTFAGPLGFNNQGVIGQEMGHGFGIAWHSSGPAAPDAFPYDSLWDVMSNAGGFSNGSCPVDDPTYGCIGQHMIAFHKEFMGWLDPSRINVPAAGTSTVTIYPLDALPSSGFVAGRIDITSTRSLWIEVRRRVGYDMAVPDASAVVMHNVNTGLSERVAQVVDSTPGDGNPNDEGAKWRQGEIYSDPSNGIEVTVDSGPAADGSYTLTVTAPGGQPPGDGFQPDAMIGLDTDRNLKGNNIYNATGARQTRAGRASPGQTVTFVIVTENDGDSVDDLAAQGDGSVPGFRVSYFSGGSRITGDVIAGNATAPGVSPGGSVGLVMVVKVKRSANIGSSQVFRFENTSLNDPSAVDVVKAKVKVR